MQLNLATSRRQSDQRSTSDIAFQGLQAGVACAAATCTNQETLTEKVVKKLMSVGRSASPCFTQYWPESFPGTVDLQLVPKMRRRLQLALKMRRRLQLAPKMRRRSLQLVPECGVDF